MQAVGGVYFGYLYKNNWGLVCSPDELPRGNHNTVEFLSTNLKVRRGATYLSVSQRICKLIIAQHPQSLTSNFQFSYKDPVFYHCFGMQGLDLMGAKTFGRIFSFGWPEVVVMTCGIAAIVLFLQMSQLRNLIQDVLL